MSLPPRWEMVKFNDCLDIKGGTQPPKSDFSDTLQQGYIRMLQIRDFESDRHAVYIKDSPKWSKCCEEDILIGRYGASVGKICTGKAGAYNVALVKAIFDNSNIDNAWVKNYLGSRIFQQPLQLLSRSAQNGFNREELADIDFPLPPLNEQRRIVARIEELSARSKSAKEALQAIPPLLEKFRQSVLAAAFRGDLTAEWRRQNPDVATGPGLNPSGSLPEGWSHARVAQVTRLITSGSRGWASFYSETGSLFLRVGNLDRDSIELDLSTKVYVQPPDGAEGKRTRVQQNDVLLAITGVDVGIVGHVVDDLGETFVNQHIALIRPGPEINPRFLAYSFRDPLGLQLRVKKLRYGATKPSLSLEQVRHIEVPLPSLEEQDLIVSSIDIHMTKISNFTEICSEAIAMWTDLDSATLTKAFRGELVPQDPNDEPASILLERIRAERTQQPAAKKKRK